jgi:iron complex transport system substrate-binding protein
VVSETTESYRLVQHAAGETQVPLHPTRIAALHNVLIESLVSLGVQPIGAVVRDIGFPPQLLELLDLATIQPLGDQNSPNLEAILALQPDLILGLYPETSSG